MVNGLVVALAVGAVVASSGRTEAARRNVLDRLEDPTARIVRVVDRTGQAGLHPDVVSRLAGISSVEWVIAFSPAGSLGRNPDIGGEVEGFAREAVGTRLFWGSLLESPLAHLTGGRPAGPGEALAGSRAAQTLGLADRIGTVEDEVLGGLAVVGDVGFDAPVESLAHYVLIDAGAASGRVGEVIILVRTSAAVEPLVDLLPGLLAVQDPRSIGVDLADELLALRAALTREVGELNTAVLLGSLALSALLVTVNLFGAIAERRREFGLRRTQGATRSTIAALVIVESGIIAVAGAATGATLSSVIVALQTGAVPDPSLSVSIGALVAVAALAGSIPAALAAAFREPLYALR